ncbi:MAG: hypothetical protein AAFP00_06020, partial [Bacteroidota bacterium]
MLYYLLDWLNTQMDIPGFGVFQYITFRAILSIIFSLIISVLIGKKIIDVLRKNLIGEVVRDAKQGPDHGHKKGTPTMGGVIILAAIVIPTLLWGDLRNGYVWLILLGTVWMGIIGFVDDYIKVFRKDKRGLQGKFKLLGQLTLGLIVGLVMLLHPDFMGSRKHISQLNKVRPNNVLVEAGFLQGDELIEINDNPIDGLPDGETYTEIATYTVTREIRSADGTSESVEKHLTIEPPKRKLIASELFGPKDKSFIYITDFPFFKEYVFDYSKVLFLDRIIDGELLGKI